MGVEVQNKQESPHSNGNPQPSASPGCIPVSYIHRSGLPVLVRLFLGSMGARGWDKLGENTLLQYLHTLKYSIELYGYLNNEIFISLKEFFF